jgi:cation diffusion facilitator CzcD-associated flavoprotein CzcO
VDHAAPDRPLKAWERRLYRALPAAQLLMRAGIYWARESFVLGFRHPRVMRWGQRLALRHLHRQVRDPGLRAKLTPTYRMGCKRVLISNDYLPALARENVEVVTDAIREVRARSIVSADGSERAVDTIIFATGFHVTDMPAAERVRGRDGRSLAEAWDGSPQAHMGAMVAGCPNLFFLVGPNTGLGHNSIVFMIESQCNYVLDACASWRRAAPPSSRSGRRLRRPTTRASRSRCAARCGPRAGARAGTSTPRGATRRCGRPSPGRSAPARAASTRRTTSCVRRARRASPSRPDVLGAHERIASVTLM